MPREWEFHPLRVPTSLTDRRAVNSRRSPAKGYDFAASSAAAACAWSELGPLPETNTVLR
jgi:hypothetical protein